jgi:hypothetical protein
MKGFRLHFRPPLLDFSWRNEGFSYFVTSIAAPAASGWSARRVGFAPTGKAPPSHGARHKRSSIRQRFCSLARVFDKKLRDRT